MAASKLTWVYGPTHRAKDVSNETLDEYQGIIRQLYLDQNMTRDEVLGHLKHVHGFTLSPSQFSKATKRWGLYKQLRQDRTSARAPKATTVQEPGQLGEVFDIEVDVSDAVGEKGTPFQTGSRFILDSTGLENTENKFSSFERDTHDQQPRSIDHSQRQPPIFEDETVESTSNSGVRTQENLEMVIENQSPHRPMSPQRPQQRNAYFEPTKSSIFDVLDHSLLPKRLLPNEYHDEKMFADYLACCYIYNDAFDYLERVFAMRTFLCLQQESCQHVIPDLFLDRLDVDEEEFAHLVETCLGVCKQWLELPEKKLSNHTLVPFDSIFLHADEAGVLQKISRLPEKQCCLDTWLEAGFLFAFIWGNAQQEASKSSSWFKRDEISEISPPISLLLFAE
ncbi:hypothetical protein FDECE_17988 [Fusarium decemcellulare]|nr:hypothetical protein FDECE_17988 [Fusarium decemcellulare]